MYPSGQPFMEQGIFGTLLGAGFGAASNLLNRGAKQEQAQQQAEMAAQNAKNNFALQTGGTERFGDTGAFKSRLLGNLANSFNTRTTGAGEPGTPGSFDLRELDLQKLFSNITAGDFGKDLRGRTKDEVTSDLDFSVPENVSTGTSFLGDLFGGLGGGAGLGDAFGGAFGRTTSSVIPNQPNASQGFQFDFRQPGRQGGSSFGSF